MINFYCVGFGDLSYTWNRFGHVSSHKIYMSKEEAEKANEGKVTMVHEFSARNEKHMNEILRCNELQIKNMMMNMQ